MNAKPEKTFHAIETLATCGKLHFVRLASGYAWQDERGRTLAQGIDATATFALACDMRLTGRKAVAAVTFRQSKAGARLPATARPHACKRSERHLADTRDMRLFSPYKGTGGRVSRKQKAGGYLWHD
jgi:hypothetical protein